MGHGVSEAASSGFPFRDLSAASGKWPYDRWHGSRRMSFVSRSVTSGDRAAGRRKESPMSTVNFMAIIVGRSGAMGSKPC